MKYEKKACYNLYEYGHHVSLASLRGCDITLFYIEEKESRILSVSCVVGELVFAVFLTAEKDTKFA